MNRIEKWNLLCLLSVFLFLTVPRLIYAKCDQNPFLYQAMTSTGSVTLLGTFHVGVEPDNFMYAQEGFINRFDDIIVESTSRTKPEFYNLDFNRDEMIKSNRPPLPSLLTPAENKMLEAEIKKAWNLGSVNGDYMYYLHPLVAMFIVQLSSMAHHDQTETIDYRIEQVGRQIKRPVLELENFNKAVLDMAPAWKDHVRELKQVLHDKTGVSTYLNFYCSGDEIGYTKHMENYRRDFPESYKGFFTTRNARWAPQLRRLFKTPGHHLVAVGVGHLLGAEGLLNIFARENVKFEKIAK